MKYIGFFLLSFTINYSCFADSVFSWHAPLAEKSLLLDIDVVDNKKLVAVGEYGHILLSTDGVQWSQSEVPSNSTLTAVFFLDQNLGWAVGHDATILHTSNGGVTWTLQQFLPELEKPLFDIAFKDKDNGIAIGSYGLIFRTVDGGENWQSEFHSEFLAEADAQYLNQLKQEDEEAYLDERAGILPHFNRLKVDGITLYLVGEMGLIAKSNDFGRNWQKLDEVYHGSFFDITRTQQGNLLVCGLRGHVYRSEKNGTPWQEIKLETTALLNAIVLGGEDKIYILGNNGVVLESKNDANSFTQYIQSDGKSLIDGVWFNDKLIAVSDSGIKQINLLK